MHEGKNPTADSGHVFSPVQSHGDKEGSQEPIEGDWESLSNGGLIAYHRSLERFLVTTQFTCPLLQLSGIGDLTT